MGNLHLKPKYQPTQQNPRTAKWNLTMKQFSLNQNATKKFIFNYTRAQIAEMRLDSFHLETKFLTDSIQSSRMFLTWRNS